MQIYYYFSYYIFDYYRRKADSAPLIASFFLPILFVYFNVFSVLYWASISLRFSPPFTKNYAFGFIIFLSLVSYFLLFYKSRYKRIFECFDKNRIELRNKYRRIVVIYIVGSVILFLSALISADIRVDGHL